METSGAKFLLSDLRVLINDFISLKVLKLDRARVNYLLSAPISLNSHIRGSILRKLLALFSSSTEEIPCAQVPYAPVAPATYIDEIIQEKPNAQAAYAPVVPTTYTDEIVQIDQPPTDLYVPSDVVYECVSDEKHQDSNDDAPRMYLLHGDKEISTSFFNELYPTKKVTKMCTPPGSFPDIRDFEGDIEFVGEGFSGIVFKSVLRGIPVVLKVSKERGERANRADYHEWSISERLKQHPNVLRIMGLCPSFQHPQYSNLGTTAIISPWQQNAGLRSFFDKRAPRDDDVCNVAFGMIQGIRSLHEQRAVHRDIAVRNFLVDADGRVLLCDFGLTEFLAEGVDRLGADAQQVSLPWRSLPPESFGGVYTTKSDIWMYGLALFELINKMHMWDQHRTPSSLKSALRSEKFELPKMENFPPVIAAIVRDCCQLEPSDRPTCGDIAEILVRSQFVAENSARDERGNTQLHRSVLSNIWQKVYSTTRGPVMINAVNNFGETPLMLAKTEDILEELLDCQRVPSCNTEPSRVMEYYHNVDLFGTLLRLAELENVDQIKFLGKYVVKRDSFSMSMYKNRENSNGETPLHIAVKKGNRSLVESLLALNVLNDTKANFNKQTVLHMACIQGREDVLETLLFERIVTSRTGDLFGLAERASTRSIVNCQDVAGKSALHYAATHGNVRVTKMLLNYEGVNVNIRDSNDCSPMFDSISGSDSNQTTRCETFASFVGHPRVDQNATDSTGETIVHKIARKGSVTEANLVVQQSSALKLSEQDHNHMYTPLHVAIHEQNFGVADVIVSTIAAEHVNITDRYGNTMLHALSSLPPDCNAGRASEFASLLLSKVGVNVNSSNAQQNSPLHVARNRAVARVLVQSPLVDVNLKNKDGLTPLHEAAIRDSVEVADLLVELKSVDADARGRYECTPLQLAARENSVKVAAMLLSRNDVDVDFINDVRETALHIAAERNNVDVLELILSRSDANHFAKIRSKQTALHTCAIGDSVEAANMLLAMTALTLDDRDADGQTPICTAVRSNSVRIAKEMLSRPGVTLVAHAIGTCTLLHSAAIGNSAELICYFIERGDMIADVRDERLRTPLHFAALHDSGHAASTLISRQDVDVNARDFEQRTPLHFAASNQSIKVTRILLTRSDIDVNSRDCSEQTPLHCALQRNESMDWVDLWFERKYKDVNDRYSIISEILILRNDVDINARDEAYQTPLHKSVTHYRFGEATKAILSRHDADAKACNKLGRTPLHTAAAFHQSNHILEEEELSEVVKVYKLLLSKYIEDVNATDDEQQAALHIAVATLNVELVEALISRDDVDVNVLNGNRDTPLDILQTCSPGMDTDEVSKLLSSRNARGKW